MRRHHWLAFTLAELLIALAILGVIATFSIPKVLQAQQDGRRSAILKEDIAMLAALTNNAVQDGITDTTLLINYARSNLNYLKRCGSNPSTQGCWDPGSASNADGYLLPNGSALMGFNQFGAPGGTYETVTLDWNGLAPPNIDGDDMLNLVLCINPATTCSAIGGTGPKVKGTVGPNVSFAPSIALYQTIFQ